MSEKQEFNLKKSFTSKQIVTGLIAAFAGMMTYKLLSGSALGTLFNWIIGIICLMAIAWFFYAMLNSKGVRKASAADSQSAQQFMPMQDKAVVYVYRNQYVGKFLGLDLVVDGAVVGQTRGHCFYRLELVPGTHTLSGDARCNGPISLSLGAGQVLFIEQTLTVVDKKNAYEYRAANDVSATKAIIGKLVMYVPQ
jgi:hypothetical protein